MSTDNSAAPEILTLTEVADLMRVSTKTLSRWIKDGRVPVIKIGRRVLFKRETIDALIEAETIAATSGPLAPTEAS